jgi:hypothetical protein
MATAKERLEESNFKDRKRLFSIINVLQFTAKF